MPSQPRIIVSVDVETNGRYPPENSMLSLGAAAYSLATGKRLATYTCNLDPLPGSQWDPDTRKWWEQFPEELKIAQADPRSPGEGIRRFAQWLTQFKRQKILASPVAYDGLWLRYYLERYCHDYSAYLRWHNMLDFRSVCWAWFGLYNGDYADWIGKLTGSRIENPQPHVAVADACHQADLFMALYRHVQAREGMMVRPDVPGWN